jgi:hypothetical protein
MNVTEPAFPRIGIETDPKTTSRGEPYPHVYSYEEAPGLTKRELLAAMAMQGLCLNTNAYYETGAHNEAIAQRAVALADALLAALRA